MLHIDGIIFSLQQHGGISVYFRELLSRLTRQQVPHVLSLEAPLRQSMEDFSANAFLNSPRRLERYRSSRELTGVAATVFHSSYYRRPARSEQASAVTVYDFVYERFASGPKRWVHMHQKHAAIRAAQVVICISESTRQDMLEFVGVIPGQTVHVIHLGVSESFRPLSIEPASTPFVLYIGERRGYKNFMQLLAAMEFLPDLELHCVGGGALRAEELAAVPAAMHRRIKHLGFVTDEALNERYNRALCLVYPSSYEGFGIPVLEAMRAGCPVVSTECKAVMEVGGDALTLAADTDPRGLADAVLRLTSTEYRSRMVSTGLEVAKNFSWDKTYESTLSVYKSMGAFL